MEVYAYRHPRKRRNSARTDRVEAYFPHHGGLAQEREQRSQRSRRISSISDEQSFQVERLKKTKLPEKSTIKIVRKQPGKCRMRKMVERKVVQERRRCSILHSHLNRLLFFRRCRRSNAEDFESRHSSGAGTMDEMISRIAGAGRDAISRRKS